MNLKSTHAKSYIAILFYIKIKINIINFKLK